MTPPRVVHVINRLAPTGGAEVSLAQMLPGLQESGVDNHVVALLPHPRPEVEQSLRRQGLSVDVLGVTSHRTAAAALTEVLRRVRPDLLHASLWDAGVAGRIAAHRAGIPALVSVVNSTSSRDAARAYGPAWRSFPHRRVEVWLARHRTTAFHALTDVVSREAQADFRLPASMFTVVPRGRSRELLGEPSAQRRAAARAALGLGPTAPVVLAVGRQERQKGHPLLVTAFATVHAAHPDAVLLIAGREGASTPEVHEAVRRHGLGASVRLLGARDDVADLLCAADVFAMPSLFEGLGGVVLEAMAMQVPVVAFDIGPVREVLGGTGRLAPAADPAGLATALVADLADPVTAATRAVAARVRFDECYEIGPVTATMARWYSEVLTRAGRPDAGG